MRTLLPALAVALIACGSATAPRSSSGGPPSTIAGTWSSWAPDAPKTPAGPELLVLRQSGLFVSGTASFGLVSWTIAGKYVRPKIALVFTPSYDPSQAYTWTGRATQANQIVLNGGTFYKQ